MISFCINAQGTLEPRSGHLAPDGQYTSPGPELDELDCETCCCLRIDSLEHGKQNLCDVIEGHWTKWVSSRRSLQMVHLNGAGGVAEAVGGVVVGEV